MISLWLWVSVGLCVPFLACGGGWSSLRQVLLPVFLVESGGSFRAVVQAPE